ncbi:DUF4007 family protein [Pontimicrobium sp. IMCC45349]|uniref:DUF4007 family protein n=1 Tax=Pontimicrobium sp. IMCC45349 TaxID=3391574 RepID=UPI00399FA85F
MTLSNSDLRFSGHDTFHCKEQWLLKGVQLVENKGFAFLRTEDAISSLGVGKNMVRSIQHWLRAFELVDEKGCLTDFSKLLLTNKEFDPYLENDASLWLLQYHICENHYASIYKLIYCDYFSDKALYEFSEYQISKFVNSKLRLNEQKEIAQKTLEADFKVFIRTYLSQTKNYKTVEDDFNVPLVSLNLVEDTGRENDKGQNVYRLNKGNHNIPLEIIAYCLLDKFSEEVSVSFDLISRTIGSYLCVSNDWLDYLLNQLATEFKEFVYKNDAGVRQIQIKSRNKNNLKIKMLEKYYD